LLHVFDGESSFVHLQDRMDLEAQPWHSRDVTSSGANGRGP
jgi:hypothetical protein